MFDFPKNLIAFYILAIIGVYFLSRFVSTRANYIVLPLIIFGTYAVTRNMMKMNMEKKQKEYNDHG